MMPRQPLSEEEREWGARLARALRDQRDSSGQSAERIAVATGVSVETVRRIERGLIPSPGFFTVARLAEALNLSLDQLASSATGATS